ncbi:hypothetical protein M3Y97_00835300 [Aphelenchoides bicaudatus]|nr:hypothetical protein M3Y97_00835300 [Aphelenchoides bicaudatus]
MGSASVLSRIDRWALISDRVVAIEWLIIFSVVDLISGFFFSSTIFYNLLFIPLAYVYVFSTIFNVAVIFAFSRYIYQRVDFNKLYKEWVKSSIRDRGNVAKLNETVSFHEFDQSLMKSHQIFHILIYPLKGNTTPSFSTAAMSQKALPLTMNRSLARIWTGFSTAQTCQRTTSLRARISLAFIMKDEEFKTKQKGQSESEESFSTYVRTNLSADDGTESIFANKSSSSFKPAVSAKRMALMKKLMSWNEDKMMDDSTKQKNFQKLMEELFACATIHRVTFNNAVVSDLTYFSANLRNFLSNNVVKPLLRDIEETNKLLAQSAANFSIGTSAVDLLVMAMMQKPDLNSTKMPYLLPFLRIHSNQTLLIHKMREFAHRPFVLHETLGSGSKSKTSFEKLGFGNIQTEPEFMTEAEFLFQLFCTYLDYRLSVNAFGDTKRPFSSVYVLKENDRPSFNQLSTHSFFIYARNKREIAFDFAINGGMDFYVTSTTETESMFAAFMLLIVYAKQYANGYLGDMRVDSKGLDLLRLFRSH